MFLKIVKKNYTSLILADTLSTKEGRLGAIFGVEFLGEKKFFLVGLPLFK